MKIVPETRLFWFLKKNTEIDLSDPAVLDMYIQQIITHGTTADVRKLFMTVDKNKIKEGLNRLKNFIPTEVRTFWEKFFCKQ